MSQASIQPQTPDPISVKIATDDGYQLAGSEYRPATTESNGNTGTAAAPGHGIGVVINGATGVLRQYYDGFARFLCHQGFTVLTYDFRGIGGSRQHAPGAPVPTMLHWGQRDMDAALSFFIERHPQLLIKGIGHSIGGQLLGVLPDNNRYHGFLNIASQHIYWKNWPLRDRALTAAFFFGVLPLFYKSVGGLPKWVLGAEYLPKQVARDWSRFGRNKAYIADEQGQPLRQGFSGYRGRMRFYAMADDRRFAPPACVRELEKLFSSADTEVRVLHPHDYDMKAIDHFGFFKKSMHQRAWQESADWLAQPA